MTLGRLRSCVLVCCAFSALLSGQLQVSFTEYSLPGSGGMPQSIVPGPDGALWFTVNVQLNGSYSGMIG